MRLPLDGHLLPSVGGSLVIVCDAACLLSMVLGLVNEILESVYVVFATLEPGVVVHASRHLVHLLEGCKCSCLV